MTDERPAPPPRPYLPTIHDAARGDIDDTEIIASKALAAVQAWSPAAIAAADFHGAADVRRRMGPITSLIYRRSLSPAAVLDAQEALRWTERTLGLCILAGQELGLVRQQRKPGHSGMTPVKELVSGGDVDRCYRMAAPTDDAFRAGIIKARENGSVSYENLLGALGGDELTDRQRQQRDTIAAMAAEGHTTRQIAATLSIGVDRTGDLARKWAIEIPADAQVGKTRKIDPLRAVTEIVPTLEGIGSVTRLVDRDDVALMGRDQAKALSTAMWDALTPIFALQRQLRDHGKGN